MCKTNVHMIWTPVRCRSDIWIPTVRCNPIHAENAGCCAFAFRSTGAVPAPPHSYSVPPPPLLPESRRFACFVNGRVSSLPLPLPDRPPCLFACGVFVKYVPFFAPFFAPDRNEFHDKHARDDGQGLLGARTLGPNPTGTKSKNRLHNGSAPDRGPYHMDICFTHRPLRALSMDANISETPPYHMDLRCPNK